MKPSWYAIEADGIGLHLKVNPSAKKDSVDGVYGDCLKISLTKPPEDGKANQGLIKFLADKLGVKKSDVIIVNGRTTKHKVVLVRGVDLEPEDLLK